MLLSFQRLPVLQKTKARPFSTSPSFASLLKECSSLSDARRIHQQILARGLLPFHSHATGIVSMYLFCNAPADALSALEHHCFSAVFWWNALIRHAVRGGLPVSALSLYRRMVRIGTRPDHFTFPFVLKACGELPSFRRGTAVHAVVCGSGFESNVFVCNALVAMYARCGVVEDARQVFDEIVKRGIDDVVSWNSMVAAYMQSGDLRAALEMFVGTATSDGSRRPDAVSLVNVLPACASLGAWLPGKQVHGFAVRNGLLEDLFVGNAIIDMYAKCEMTGDAVKVFDGMKSKDVVSWNAMVTGYAQSGSFDDALRLFEEMRAENIALNVVTWSAVIAGYAQRGHGHEALDVFRQMQLSGSEPNAVTLVSLLSACAAVGALLHGRETHGHTIKCLINWEDDNDGDDLMVKNALIDMYSKCKSAEAARAMFDSIVPAERNVVTWTVMIGGYAQHGDANHALELFSQMLRDAKTLPNAFTISCSLMACARLAALRFGRQIHAYVIRNRYEAAMLFVANCLIDMYSKCGDIDTARTVFSRMSQRNAVSWTSLMTGYGMHGHGDDALQVFDGMREVGLVPDGVTFIVVLYACSHAGMVDRGLSYFRNMEKDFGVVPGVEHYACVVDLLGRAGHLDKARELIEGMPMEPSMVVWVALLSACRLHANVELGEYAARQLLELESENDGSYTLLSNIYANAGRWRDVARIRSLMKNTGIKKRPGCSWIQGKKGMAAFFVGDKSHPQSQQIYEVLANLIQRIKAIGYVPETSFALHDVDDEEKGSLLSEHSEKLALAFGIMTSSPGAPIRITKNLRVCGDCHTAITFVSKIVDHEIILRDSSRFHHFKKGSCSCGGYW
ncbi:pentatricopeptide repeat-containing protein At5g16860-like [Magnolia sinica]|uniref:pentatricopeptide repeat-containing protein At5g16860-like n=1 Tax=Magnolia sinica TaxID=86752 RepID=UPI00265AF37D|nr:pentatricopeptide repeat-containing protein At5g16860-like [Magnolia sinica]